MTAADPNALLAVANLADAAERLMLADAFEESGDDLAANVLRELDIQCWAEEEDISPEVLLDDEDADWVRDEVEAGNLWAWCVVTVSAVYYDGEGEQHTGEDYLSGCSYRSEADFKAPDGYYPDMVRAAVLTLLENVREELDD